MKFFHSIILLLILASCAQINPLTGGLQDTTSPQIDSSKSIPYNGQINYTTPQIKLKFDEYIVLSKPNENIIITPRPSLSPTVLAKNKNLTITFNEPLLENTTYTVSFNRAITDITEKNDSIFQYVFSTGSYIDSMSIQGTVTDAITNKGASSYLIALYPGDTESNFDSLPYKIKPSYIGQTDNVGAFKISHVKEGVYYLFAIDDKNKNLLLNPDEYFAFLPSKSILINNETAPVQLKSFINESAELKLLKTNFNPPGQIEFIFSKPVDTLNVATSCDLLQEQTGRKDSLLYWLTSSPTAGMTFNLSYANKVDTLKPVYKKATADITNLDFNNNIVAGKLLPNESLKIIANQPVKLNGINSDKIKIFDADSVTINYTLEIENLRTLVFKDLKGKAPFVIKIDSAAVVSFYGAENKKSITYFFENHPASYFGELIVNTDSVFTENVLVYLLDNKGNVLDTVDYAKQLIFTNLKPGDYQLRLLVDEDKNGQWTSGSLTEGRIPEKFIYFNGLIAVKSKWEMEVDWILKKGY